MTWTHSQCEECWNAAHPDGRVAVRVKDAEPEPCCFCGKPTTAGICVRHDPRVDDPRRSYVTAADDAGLRRVMQAGLQEYADSRGLSVTRPARGERSEGDGPPLA